MPQLSHPSDRLHPAENFLHPLALLLADRVLPPASSFPNFATLILPGPPYTGDRSPLVALVVDPALKEATVQQYGLEVQQQYKSYLFSLAYAGAKSTHVPISSSNNQSRLASP